MSRPSRFEGTIGRTIADSEHWFDDPPHPGSDAPNVVLARASPTTTVRRCRTGTRRPFPFEGTLHAVEIQLLNRQDVESRDAEAAAEMSRQ